MGFDSIGPLVIDDASDFLEVVLGAVGALALANVAQWRRSNSERDALQARDEKHIEAFVAAINSQTRVYHELTEALHELLDAVA